MSNLRAARFCGSALALAALFSLGLSTSAVAAGNIATLASGAAVVYSSPLKNGATANSLLDSKRHTTIHFVKNASGHSLFAVDLGKSYKVATVSMTFAKNQVISIFVLSGEPPSGSSWASMIAGMAPTTVITSGSPATLNDFDGEYVVFDLGTYTGPISNLLVTGEPVQAVPPAVVTDIVGLQGISGVNATPLDETPIPKDKIPVASP